MSLARVSTSLLAKAQQGLGVTGGRPAAALRRFNDRFNDEPSQQAKDKVSDPSTEKLVKQAENEVAEVEKQRLGKDAGDDVRFLFLLYSCLMPCGHRC